MAYRTLDELTQGLDMVRAAPPDEGRVRLIVRRPGPSEREVMEEAQLDVERGLIGDSWIERPAKGSDRPSPYSQVTIMNARFTELITGDPGPDSWAQAGDQLYLDFDLSMENLPTGSCLEVGEARLEISAEPHMGCVLFSGRFGSDALRMTASQEGRAMRLRGANTVVVRSGLVRTGDLVRKVS